MKDAADAIDNLLSQLETILRYVAPGFAALYVIAAVIPDSRPFLMSASFPMVVLGILLGFTIYAVHTGVLLRLLWFPIVWFHKHKQINCKSIWEEMWYLDEQRWLRRASEEKPVLSIQKEMDKWGAMQNFLYCLSYTMILIPLGTWMCRVANSASYAIFVGGCLILAVAVASEIRMTRKDIELADRYHNGKRPELDGHQEKT